MRTASAAEIEALLEASETGQNYLPLVPRSPAAARLKGIGPAQVIRATEEFLTEWLPSININVRGVRELLEMLHISCAIIPDSVIDAGYATDSGIIGIRRGFIEFLRHRAALNVLTAALARMKRLAA